MVSRAMTRPRKVYDPEPMCGYIYVPHDAVGPLSHAAPGRAIRMATLRQWIPVHHGLETVMPHPWSGRVWWVRIVDPVTAREVRRDDRRSLPWYDLRRYRTIYEVLRDTGGRERLLRIGYTPSKAVEVEREVPLSNLFGAQGEAVVEIIHVAGGLTWQSAAAFAAARHSEAGAIQIKGWHRWLDREGIAGPENSDRILSEAESLGGAGKKSPVGRGLDVIGNQLFSRAQKSYGEKAVSIDEEGEYHLLRPWTEAGSALRETAFAFGAPDLFDARERAVLAQAWLKVIGAPPGRPERLH